MMTLQASSRTGHYIAAVMPVIDTPDRSEYQVVVFRHGHEVYQQNGEKSRGRHTDCQRLPRSAERAGFRQLDLLKS